MTKLLRLLVSRPVLYGLLTPLLLLCALMAWASEYFGERIADLGVRLHEWGDQ